MRIKTKLFQLVVGSCLLSFQAVAQNGTTQKSGAAINLDVQIRSLEELVKGSTKPWESSVYIGKEPQSALKEIYDRTSQALKSPLRTQKMGGMDGGGGNALLCEEDGKFTLDLLDVREADDLGLELDLGPKREFVQIFQHTLSKLSRISPARAAVYGAMGRDLLTKDTQWAANRSMPIIDDVKLAIIPRGCVFLQVAIQRPLDQKNIPNAKTYIIDKDVFYLMDETSKAALVLHEVLYREARHNGKTDSVFTRHLVGEMMSTNMSKYDLVKFNDLYEKNGLMCRENISIPSFSRDFILYPNVCDHIKDLQYSLESNFKIKLGTLEEGTVVSGKLKGRSGILINEFLPEINPFNSHSKFQSVRSHLPLDGELALTIQKSDNSYVNFPKIQITNGSFAGTASLTSVTTTIPKIETAFDWKSFKNYFNHAYASQYSTGEKNKDGSLIVKKNELSHGSIEVFGKQLEFVSPHIKYIQNESCKLLDTCLSSIRIDIYNDGDFDLGMGTISPEDYFFVYSPKTKDNNPKSKNGWVYTNGALFSKDGIPTHYSNNKIHPEFKWLPVLR